MRWFWARREPEVANGIDEAREAASDALTAAQGRSGEVDRVANAADRQAERSRRYLAQLDAVYRLRRGAT